MINANTAIQVINSRTISNILVHRMYFHKSSTRGKINMLLNYLSYINKKEKKVNLLICRPI